MRLLHMLTPAIGTKRHCSHGLISCPESGEVRTRVEGHGNPVQSLSVTQPRQC